MFYKLKRIIAALSKHDFMTCRLMMEILQEENGVIFIDINNYNKGVIKRIGNQLYMDNIEYIIKDDKILIESIAAIKEKRLTFTQVAKKLNMVTPDGKDINKTYIQKVLNDNGVMNNKQPASGFAHLFVQEKVEFVKDGIYNSFIKTTVLPKGVDLIRDYLLNKGCKGRDNVDM